MYFPYVFLAYLLVGARSGFSPSIGPSPLPGGIARSDLGKCATPALSTGQPDGRRAARSAGNSGETMSFLYRLTALLSSKNLAAVSMSSRLRHGPPAGLENDRELDDRDSGRARSLTQRELPRLAMWQRGRGSPTLNLFWKRPIASCWWFPLRSPRPCPGRGVGRYLPGIRCRSRSGFATWLQAFLERECRLVRFDPQHRRLSARVWTGGFGGREPILRRTSRCWSSARHHSLISIACWKTSAAHESLPARTSSWKAWGPTKEDRIDMNSTTTP